MTAIILGDHPAEPGELVVMNAHGEQVVPLHYDGTSVESGILFAGAVFSEGVLPLITRRPIPTEALSIRDRR